MRKRVVGSLRALALSFGLVLFAGNGLAKEPIGAQGFAALTAIEVGHLNELRGGDGDTTVTVQSTQNLDAAVSGSSFSAGTLSSGGVTIGEHAMDNFSGVGLFNIVTGNGNAVDAAIGITFNLQ